MGIAETITTPHPVKLSVEDYMLLDRSGAFDSYAKTELIDGTIYVVNAQFSAHLKAKVRLLRRLADACDALGSGMEAWSEGAIAMSPSSMPEPDVFITTAMPDDGPIPLQNVVLVVEVSDTTQTFDLGQKLQDYAENGVPEYWVVDLKAKLIHRMWSPRGKGYAEGDEVALGERIEAATIAGLGVETGGLE